ncbi:EAL domain-containing protein [Thiotrichales bacterium 19S3-7]|nr:EAL domain-containing protein [Thiotrichales bacterium 19S3-7]MCF6800943.1 EAL domain-containing protein [Thiotrichales bacterium 19S3-11]
MDTETLLLITDDEKIETIINAYSKSYQIDTYQYKTLDHQTLEAHNYAAILLDCEKAKDFLELNLPPSKIKIPIIYLLKEGQKKPHKMDQYVLDQLNTDKLTLSGFERAISTNIEKSQLYKELNQQLNTLKKLTHSFDYQQTDNQDHHCNNQNELSSLHDLINENKLLIKKVRQQNELLQKLASNDVLTDIPNRRNFEETLHRLLAHAQRHQHILALLFIDLDKFKNVNDTLGHQMGDLLLKDVALRLKDCLRKGDFVARIGGDEFAVILHEIKSTHAAGIVAWKIIQELDKLFILNNHTANISASIGISCFPMIADNENDLIKNADIAMYQAKTSSDFKYAYATLNLHKDHIQQLTIEQQLKQALKNNEFTMVYQPIYSLPDCKLHGFESLIRWNNSVLGNIPPDQFIPIAEETGMIHSIGRWIFEAVCKQVAHWSKLGKFPYKISVNLSPVQLTEAELFKMISKIIDQYQLPYQLFEFEITEMAVMQHGGNMLDKLHKLGTSHALDDFGTGYSSISRLKYLPITTIKIDKTFIQGLGVEDADNSIVSSLIALARKLNLNVVAEGVETKAQLDLLVKENCDFVQGYYFSKPLTPKDAKTLIINAQ